MAVSLGVLCSTLNVCNAPFAEKGFGSNFRRVVHSGVCGNAAATYCAVQLIGVPPWPGLCACWGKWAMFWIQRFLCKLQMVLCGEPGNGSWVSWLLVRCYLINHCCMLIMYQWLAAVLCWSSGVSCWNDYFTAWGMKYKYDATIRDVS